MMRNIVLIGMPGCGKSTVGVVLAKTLGTGFTDTDLIIQQREKRLLQNIIDTDGLEAFLDIEMNAILSVEDKGSVIATGGSAVLREKAMKKLAEDGVIVFLDVSPETLAKRLANIRTRGIAAPSGQSIEEIYSERIPLYRQYADIVLKADEQSVEKTVEKLIAELNRIQ